MKIVSNDPAIAHARLSCLNTADKGTCGKFEEIFSQALDQSLSKASAPGGLSAAIGTASVRPGLPCPPPHPGLSDRVDGFLDVLEGYRQRLADPNLNLRDIQPWVQKMETEVETLMPSLRSIPESDGMRAILDQTLITASVEIHRFNRGDYVPQ